MRRFRSGAVKKKICMNEGPGGGWNRAGYKLTVTVAARFF